MNAFFMYWVDLFAMVSSVAISVFLLVRIKRKSIRAIRSLALFFVIFGPVVIAVHMSLHLLEITYHALTSAVDGSFKYNFRFYSLQLMGALIGYLSLKFLASSIYYVKNREDKHQIYKTAGWIALISLPTIPFTPIGSLPAIACVFTIVAITWVHKRKISFKISGIKTVVPKQLAELYQ